MQITRVEVTPVELKTRQPVQMVGVPVFNEITAVFVRIETRDGRNAWGCGVVQDQIDNDETLRTIRIFQECADLVPSLHPLDIEYSLAELAPLVKSSPAAICAFDLAFHDLLGLYAGIPLYKLLGGYRNRIQTSVTIPKSSVEESVELARERARLGFRILKIKGGFDPDEDVQRVKAIRRALPDHILRLDPDGGYSVSAALDVARVLDGQIEMLEQPTSANDLTGLNQVTRHSPVPVLADQSVRGPNSALELAANKIADGLSIKIASCGGFRCARKMDAIAQAANLVTMVSCNIEPAMLVAAGLSFALSSANVVYGDLDGHLELIDDPTIAGFELKDGWLVIKDIPGLGCTLDM